MIAIILLGTAAVCAAVGLGKLSAANAAADREFREFDEAAAKYMARNERPKE